MKVTEIFSFRKKSSSSIPLFLMSVSAGHPVPVDTEIEREIDLNEFLVKHPASTFFARVKGERMHHADINDGDILIVDTSLDPVDGNVVIVSINGEITVKIYRNIRGDIYLESQNKQFLPLSIDPYVELKPIGVVTKVIHSL